jgi:3-oxoacyl-[acyl-carrier-protein] synthase-3
LENIDYLLLHQANKYMDDKIANKLKVPQEKVPYSIMQCGNTSSASIPMTVVVGVGQSIENQKADCIMCGFGSGLSWGSAFVTLDHIVCPELIEVE